MSCARNGCASDYARSMEDGQALILPKTTTTLRMIEKKKGGGALSVERVTPGEKVLGSIPPVAARSLLVGSVSV